MHAHAHAHAHAYASRLVHSHICSFLNLYIQYLYLFIYPPWSGRLKLPSWFNHSQIWNTSRRELMRLKNNAQLTTPLSNFILVTNTLLVSNTSSSVIQTLNGVKAKAKCDTLL